MADKFKYNSGDYIGPDKNILFLGRTRKGANGGWWGNVVCPYDDVVYEARLSEALSGKGYQHCGCQTRKRRIQTRLNGKYKLKGKTFGRLTVLEDDTGIQDNSNNILRKCICSCPERNIVYKTYYYLTTADCPSCGCYGKEISQKNGLNNAKDITNNRYGKLVAKYFTGRVKKTKTGSLRYWYCECDCGGHKEVHVNDLETGKVISCGHCLCSSGEEKVKQILENQNIAYEFQKIFNDCVNPKTGYKLEFDFYLSEYNCCIEYDGKQHFEYQENTAGWNNKENFEKVQYRDNIKNNYCEEHNIKLIRIPYWDFDKLDDEYLLSLLNN